MKRHTKMIYRAPNFIYWLLVGAMLVYVIYLLAAINIAWTF